MSGDLARFAAVNARVRAILPTLLGRTGLAALCSYPSAVLKDALTRTAYGRIATAEISAEHMIGLRFAAVANDVLRLLPDPERSFLHAYLLHHEVENLKIILRAVHRGVPWETVAPQLVPLAGIETIDRSAVASARDLRDLADRLAATPYAVALRHALHRIDSAGVFAAEVAVEIDYYERLWSATAWLRAADAARARNLLGILFDILNLGWIARYRDVLQLSSEEILSYTLRQGRWITTPLRQALAADRTQSWDAVLAGTPYAPLLADVPARSFDAQWGPLWRLLSAEVQRALRGYPFHVGVPLGFLLMQEIEIRDLRMVLAGKSLGVPPPEIEERLSTTRA